MEQVTYRVQEETKQHANAMVEDDTEPVDTFSEAMRALSDRGIKYDEVKAENEELQSELSETRDERDALREKVSNLEQQLEEKTNQYQTLFDELVKYDP